MPFYVGEDMPEWGEWIERMEAAEEADDATLLEGDGWDQPRPELFKYLQPEFAPTGLLSFPHVPGPKPADFVAEPEPQSRGFWARLFGKPPPPPPSPRDEEELLAEFRREESARSQRALWEVSREAAALRTKNIKRVFGAYDGGGDESFTSVRGAELMDGRSGDRESLELPVSWDRLEKLVEQAADALMGGYDAGPFALRGVLTIDLLACTIEDERDLDVVFRRLG